MKEGEGATAPKPEDSDLVNEEIWNIVKKMKNPTINFKTLNHLTVLKTKELKSELF